MNIFIGQALNGVTKFFFFLKGAKAGSENGKWNCQNESWKTEVGSLQKLLELKVNTVKTVCENKYMIEQILAQCAFPSIFLNFFGCFEKNSCENGVHF